MGLACLPFSVPLFADENTVATTSPALQFDGNDNVETDNHYENGLFMNPAGSPKQNRSLFKWTRFVSSLTLQLFLPKQFDNNLVLNKKEYLQQQKAVAQQNSITWLGHSTFLIRLAGQTILTDPFLSDYAAPFPVPGVYRYTAPIIAPKELPRIDIIVISHNHYDHLDRKTLKVIAARHNPIVFVPLGVGSLISKIGFKQVVELDWYETQQQANLQIQALPAIHKSARNLFDKNKTLWSGWAIKSKQHKIYFAGDTGYGDVFKEIGKRVGPFDTALVPIGAYEPVDVLGPLHVSPEQAIKVGMDVAAKHLIAMHWGTLPFSTEPIFDPPKRFLAGDYPAITRTVMRIGESRLLEKTQSQPESSRLASVAD